MSGREIRTERLIAFFTERGYQPILIAKSNLIPPDVYLLGEERYRRLGSLRDLLKPETALPEPEIGKAPELELVETHGGEARLSFNFFSKLLENFGLTGSPKGSAKASLASNERLRFQDVTVRTVSPIAIETALNDGLDTKKLGMDRIDQKVVHVAYEYLYSSKVEVILGNGRNASIGLSASISNAIDAKADVSAHQKGVDATSHQKKDSPVAVAFKAALLVKHGSRWRLKLMDGSGSGIAPGHVKPYIFKPDAILTIED